MTSLVGWGGIARVTSSGIASKVMDIIDDVDSQADEAYSKALEMIELLKSFVYTLEDISTGVTVEDITKPDALAIPNVNSDISFDPVYSPTKVTLDPIDTDVTVSEPEKPNVSVELPPLPTPPSFHDLPAPTLSFTYNESGYSTNLDALLQQVIYDEISNGSTGIPAAIESDIYARESERDLLALQDTKDRIANIWAESGMSLPDGVLVSALNAAEIEYQNKYSDKSRDVRIESFKRADENARFIKGLAVQFETVVRDYMGKYWQRQLDAATATLSYAQAVYEVWIKYEELFLNRYIAETQGYKATADASASLLEAKAKVYQAEVDYMIGRADVDVKTIGANLEYQKTKVAVGELDIRYFDSHVNYVIGKAEATVKAIALKFEHIKALVTKYQADTQMYEVDGRVKLGKAEVAMRGIEARIDVLKTKVSAAVSAMGSIGQIAATIVAGALSAINANASLSASESLSDTYSGSESISTINQDIDQESYSEIHQYNHDA